MKGFQSTIRSCLAALLVGALAACGGGGKDAVPGFDTPPLDGAPLPPMVTAVVPVVNGTGIATNNSLITAAFGEAVALTGTASFVVTCAAPCVSPSGTVALDSTNRVATYALAPGTSLAGNTTYTATVTAASSLATGLAMTAPYVWRFTTGVVPDTTRPRVLLTVPATNSENPNIATTDVPTNAAVMAVFTEEMAPISISGSNFTVSTCTAELGHAGSPCGPVAGVVTYVVGNRTVVFTPSAPLAASTTYVATITAGATDLAGNALVDFQGLSLPLRDTRQWRFATAAGPIPQASVSVQSSNPTAGASGVCTDATINATFSVPSGLRIDPATINSSVFTVRGPGNITPTSVVLDSSTGRIATFTPMSPLTPGVLYTATIKGGAAGAKDLAIPGDTMLADTSWTFTAVNCAQPSLRPVALGSASTFGAFGAAGVTSEGNGIVNGDVGTTAVSTAVTGLHDAGPGCSYTETLLNAGTVNGLIYTDAPPPACPSEGNATTFAIATQARADAQAAYDALAALPAGPDPAAGNLFNVTLGPGVYTAAAGSFTILGGLVLDAQGDPNATWVFQMASTLTVGSPDAFVQTRITLANGAQAANVFWQVAGEAVINRFFLPGEMVGTIISQAGVRMPGGTPLNGRALSLGGPVTTVNVINVPAP